MEAILAQLVPVIVAIVGGLLSVAAIRLSKWIKAKTAAEAADVVGNIIISVVGELNADIVAELKAFASDGKLTKKEIKDVKRMAEDRVKDRVPDAVSKIAAAAVGDLEAYISGRIEYIVGRMKH